MPVTYTNRKGYTYFLCRGTTKTGKPRYSFAREIKGEPVEEIPAGYEISESVNGIVSLVKKRLSQIRPEEIATVEAAVARHPKHHNYRVNARHDRIDVYERAGPDPDELANQLGGIISGLDRLKEIMDRRAQFTPVLRFTLRMTDAQKRTFGVQRMCYLGSIDDWIDIGAMGPVDELARDLIPKLGSDRFFELY